jgi:hypothetical protein
MTEDYGLVNRTQCVCGDVIIVASNASDELISIALGRHNRQAAHIRYSRLVGWSDNPSEKPLEPDPDRAMTGTDYPASDVGREPGSQGRVNPSSSRPPRGGFSISPDGYDFTRD